MRPLIDTPVTPNQLTTLRLATGIAAAAALAVGETPWQHVGAAVFVFSILLDRADGELARISGKTTPWGHNYDLIADTASNTLIFIGLGLGLRDSVLGAWAVPLGVVAGVAVAMIFLMVIRVISLAGPKAAEFQSFAGFDPDDTMLVIPLAVWAGWSVPLVVAAAIGSPAFLVFFIWLFRRRLRAAG